jgi:hypothetical protein
VQLPDLQSEALNLDLEVDFRVPMPTNDSITAMMAITAITALSTLVKYFTCSSDRTS